MFSRAANATMRPKWLTYYIYMRVNIMDRFQAGSGVDIKTSFTGCQAPVRETWPHLFCRKALTGTPSIGKEFVPATQTTQDMPGFLLPGPHASLPAKLIADKPPSHHCSGHDPGGHTALPSFNRFAALHLATLAQASYPQQRHLGLPRRWIARDATTSLFRDPAKLAFHIGGIRRHHALVGNRVAMLPVGPGYQHQLIFGLREIVIGTLPTRVGGNNLIPAELVGSSSSMSSGWHPA